MIHESKKEVIQQTIHHLERVQHLLAEMLSWEEIQTREVERIALFAAGMEMIYSTIIIIIRRNGIKIN